jgi:preprotein translocase subunit SecA
MMDSIAEEMTGFIFNVEVNVENQAVEAKGFEAHQSSEQQLRYSGAVAEGGDANTGGTSRNAPCPCGSGKKYKRCHGAA